ncbi:MAG: FprA family A-type flavoprotein [Christensenellaceae bacterium]|jgi:flavorubredoxin|nr:FprA family A-type flavoprotein [Christensenellaceae bacterium]
MKKYELKPGLFYVGIKNPTLRTFDIVMRTDYGTTYNSYLIKDEKNALIETAHHSFFDSYIESVQEIVDLNTIDYIILNHTEPDHSGSLNNLVKLCPHATVVCTTPASIYLKAITNNSAIKFQIAKNGDTISLGRNSLQFILAPFLHWPDTMFTYCSEMSTVFTCDFLGAHYCEDAIVDSKIHYVNKYKHGFLNYYNDIFSPFKKHVLEGLKKLSGLPFDMACVSHGPVLTSSGLLNYAMDSYYALSNTVMPQTPKITPVFYCSAYGFTRKIADAIVKEINKISSDYNCQSYDIIEHDMNMLIKLMNESVGFLIGSPTINRDTVPPVLSLLSHIDAINSAKKPVGVFGSYGWSGEAIPTIVARLSSIKLNPINSGLKINFNPSISDDDQIKAYAKDFTDAIASYAK